MRNGVKGALPLIGVIVLAVLFAFGQRFGADRQPPDTIDPRNTGTIAYASLPSEARAVVRAIADGGPFRYDRDGATFGNRERLLPVRPRGYYREYTVPTPGESDRGARRIVASVDGTLYWTADHYASFRRVVGGPRIERPDDRTTGTEAPGSDS